MEGITSEQIAAELSDDRLEFARTARKASRIAPGAVSGPRRDIQACEVCEAEFRPKIVSVLGHEVFRQTKCFACVAKANASEATKHANEHAEFLQQREKGWADLCPWTYRTAAEGGETSLERLGKDCPRLLEITDSRLGPRGLLLKGPTGLCKTRAAWRLVRKCFDAGSTIRAVTAGEFARQYADAAGRFERSSWFDDLATADLVFLDDLGKSAWTVGVEGEFFDLVEARMKHGKPMLITTNEVGSSLEAKAKDINTMQPLLRRLREMQTINLLPN